MKPNKQNRASNPGEELDHALNAMRAEQPDRETMNAAGERVWQRVSHEAAFPSAAQIVSIRGCEDVRALLPQYRHGQLAPARALLVESHLHECVSCRREAETGKRERNTLAPWKQELPQVANTGFRWVAAAAAIVIFAVATYFVQDQFFSGPQGMRARVESLNGVLSRVGYSGDQPLKVGDEVTEGQRVRTGGGSHAMLRLRDGSVVEMNERAEFGVMMGRKDTTIQLERGNIIIQAAKRQTGHLYVAARDCRVSVTGTVFSVNAGMKGSRVSVIEGEVRVAEAGAEKVLHPGDQLTTNASLGTVPVKQEIAWSQNLDKHLALLAEFAHLSNKLETVQMPGLRYKSNILATLPANTVVFAGIPNLGDAVQQANKLFQQELQESAVLREWWQQVQAGKKNGPEFDEMINYVHDLGQYLGDEIVFSVALNGHDGEPLVVAQVQHDGLKQFIQQEAAKYADTKEHIRIVDEQELNQISAQQGKQLLILVRSDFVAAAGDAATLKQFVAGLNGGGGGFAGTSFGQRIAAQYKNGAGILFGANLAEMTSAHKPRNPEQSSQFALTGLGDVEYLIAERKGNGAQVQNHAQLTFVNQRRGLASWLAAPAPIGGLDFVSTDAGAVAAFISKNPAEMLDDVLNLADASGKDGSAKIAQGESELKIQFHRDLADTLGGEVTIALDGPILPTPSWKIVAEVKDPGRLQSTIQQLVTDVNDHVKDEHPGVALDQETANGLTFYTIRSTDATKPFEATYTFTDGYMILGPSKALVMNAIAIHQSGNSLARSTDFRALLPQDEQPDVSAVLYQNLAPVIQPIAQQLSPSQLQSLQQIAAETKPSVVCAYGESNAIRVASSSRLFGFDLNTAALTTLMKVVQPFTSARSALSLELRGRMPATIEMQNLTVQLGNRTILNQLNGALSGRCIGLLGPNGSGKSTLINTLLGFYQPVAGAACIFGKEVKSNLRELRAMIGYMPESDAFIADMTGVRFVRYMAELSGLPRGEAMERAHEAFFYVGLGEARYRKLGTYSLGMKQLAKLAQAIAHGPKLVLLDEPTNGLDPEARIRMLQLVREIRDTGEVSVLISSHLLRDIEECCDQVLILKDGRIAALCNLEEERKANLKFLELDVTQGNGFLESVRGLGCECASFGAGRVRIVLPDNIDLRQIYRTAAEHEVQIRRMNYRRDTLEDIFLKAMAGTPPVASVQQGSANGSL